MREKFKSWEDVQTVLEYLESLGEYKDGTSYLGKFIYLLIGYRKYADTEFLNDIPFNILAKMLYGFIQCEPDAFYIMESEIYHNEINWNTYFDIALTTNWKIKLKEEKENKNELNVLKIKELEKEISRLKGELNEE